MAHCKHPSSLSAPGSHAAMEVVQNFSDDKLLTPTCDSTISSSSLGESATKVPPTDSTIGADGYQSERKVCRDTLIVDDARAFEKLPSMRWRSASEIEGDVSSPEEEPKPAVETQLVEGFGIDGVNGAGVTKSRRGRSDVFTKRASRRVRKHIYLKAKVPKTVHRKNFQGEIIDPKGHPAHVDAATLQLGIRVTVGRMASKEAKPPKKKDFAESLKYKFAPAGTDETPPHTQPSFNFKDYCPSVFHFLRVKLFNLDSTDYMDTLCSTLADGTNALRIMGTPGKSGSLFFFSHDMRFVVKTLPRREAKVLVSILPEYTRFIQSSPASLLPRFYGLHRIKHKATGRAVHFVVMNYLFSTNHEIHQRFDLKGSRQGRSASEHEKKMGQKAVLKDNDLIEIGTKLCVPAKRKLMKIVRADVDFLQSLDIMDYSLLVGVHKKSESDFSSWRVEDAEGLASRTPLGEPLSASTLDLDPEAEVGLGDDSDEERTVILIEATEAAVEAEVETEAGQDAGADNGLCKGIEAVGGDEVYYIGVIDILMLYTLRKQVENVYKSSYYSEDAEGVSSKPAKEYAERFFNFIDSVVE
uniref:PIPK domain-containing protein n=1 Tax=Corethron hystrix TaxID=216773 RepID=A0A6U5GIH1_9STRA|mmetsp:Transcript_26992/g.62086  ORF Transcript_26992/g.62086 Transcript_26992/m.62086 type:complete len:583 (+) Transcript_26992:90-1838(+)